jgi:uncharacterized protein (TIGR02722 family)
MIRFKNVLCAGLLSACAAQPTQLINPRTDPAGITMGLDGSDFSGAAQTSVQKMLTSGAVNHPGGGRYVIAISRVTNDTMQRIDTDQLVKKIRVALLNSGRAVITTAVGANGPEDDMTFRTRELRQSAEFNQRNVAARHELAAPDLSLSGKILQQDNRVEHGQRVDYLFQLSLTDLHSGLAVWEDEEPISKLGTNRTVAW